MPRNNPHGVTGLQRRDGWWLFEWRWTDPVTGQRHRIRRVPDRSLTDAQVKQWARRIKAGVLTGRIAVQKVSAPRLSVALKKYLDHCASIPNEPTTLKRKRAQRNVVIKQFGDVPLSDVCSQTVASFRARMLRDGKTVATANRYLSFIKHFASWALAQNWMDENQVAGLRRIKQTNEGRPKPRALSREEERRLLAHARPELRPLIIVAADTGLRRSELLRLRWGDLDLPNRRLTVPRSKNKKSRTLRLTLRAVDTLQHLQRFDDGYVFHDWLGRHWQAHSVRSCFITARERAKVSCRFHHLRHTFGTRLADAGATPYEIMKAMGHSTLEMALRYVEATGRNVEEAISRMESTVAALAHERAGGDEQAG